MDQQDLLSTFSLNPEQRTRDHFSDPFLRPSALVVQLCIPSMWDLLLWSGAPQSYPQFPQVGAQSHVTEGPSQGLEGMEET